MALIKLGPIIAGASGSIGGTTLARNRSGAYARARTKPVNPRSDRQSAARALIMFLTAYWSSALVSAAQRTAWATYAASINMKNKLGEVIQLTGFNHFIACNAARMTVGGSVIAAAPTILSLPGADITLAMIADSGTNFLTIAFDDTQDWCSETGGFLSVSLGQPQLVTRNYFSGPYRNAGAIIGNTGVPITSPQTLVAPFTLVAGQKLFASARIVRADARISSPMNFPSVLVDGLLPAYTGSGSTAPDVNGVYNIVGGFNGKAFYKWADGSEYLWWDGVDTWNISAALGTPGAAYWTRTDPDPAGLYVVGGTAEGAITMV